MEVNHEPVRHLRYLRQSLSQDSESIGFFISAGCPLAVKVEKEKGPLIPDVALLSRHINAELETNESYQVLLGELGKAGRGAGNVEVTLSFLRSLLAVARGAEVRGLNEGQLLELEREICRVIVSKLNVSLPSQDSPYHQLGNWIGSIDRKVAIEIFTTNYDLLMEQALEDLEIPYFDGFVGSKRPFFDLRALEEGLIPSHWSRLWKIHGSINWHKEELAGQSRVCRSSEIKSGVSHLIYPSHLKYEESRKMPYLALIDQLGRFLKKKSSFLVLSGYSFSDGHINDTIVNALKANPTAMVLGLMYGKFYADDGAGGKVERYPEAYRLAMRQHNLNIWTFDKAIIGTNLGSWGGISSVGDEDLDLARYVYQEAEGGEGGEREFLVKLGDFALFAEFLKRMIGVRQGG